MCVEYTLPPSLFSPSPLVFSPSSSLTLYAYTNMRKHTTSTFSALAQTRIGNFRHEIRT